MSVPQKVSVPTATLDENRRKARYGVAYLRSVCAQAGVGMNETSPDEDVLAVDCSLEFAEAPVRVQVKCTSRFSIGGRSASWALEDEWLASWVESKVPVYFVLVIVDAQTVRWMTHHDDGTDHRAAAFWRRLLPTDMASRLHIPKRQRLTADTLARWHGELLASFTPGGTP